MKVVDDFLPSLEFRSLHDFMMGEYFNWYYTDGIAVIPQPGKFQFIHNFYGEDGERPTFGTVIPIIKRLNIRSLIRVKANLNPRTVFHRNGGYHTDFASAGPHKTAIFYVNTNNGYTKFKKGGKVKSVANRMVIFDSELEHDGITCTDEKRRVVINFNYYA